MITGLDKSTKMLNDHYARAYHKFVIDAYSSNELIIIGYSFSDYHINSVFRNCVYENKELTKLIIVDNATINSEVEKKIETFFIKILSNYWNNKLGDWIEIRNFERTKIDNGIFGFKLKNQLIPFPIIEFHLNGTLDFIEKYKSIAKES
jgi:hypothetical protein